MQLRVDESGRFIGSATGVLGGLHVKGSVAQQLRKSTSRRSLDAVAPAQVLILLYLLLVGVIRAYHIFMLWGMALVRLLLHLLESVGACAV